MAKNTRKHSEAVRKKVLTAAVICAVLLILAAIIGTGLLRSAQKEQRKREEKAGVFEPYQPYGLVYDKKKTDCILTENRFDILKILPIRTVI